MTRVEKAREFAVEAHGDQKYGDGRPYVVHLDEVEAVAREFGYGDDEEVRVAAILHDVLEDTPATEKDLRAAGFTMEEVALVEFCTDRPGKNRRERKAATYRAWKTLFGQATPTWLARASAVKLADRIGNLRSCHRNGLAGLLSMYRKEKDTFKAALHGPDMLPAMWAEYDRLLGDKP